MRPAEQTPLLPLLILSSKSGFGGGDSENQKDKYLTINALQVPRESDEREIRRVQHQLDTHKHDERIAPHEYAHRADAEKNRAEDDKVIYR